MNPTQANPIPGLLSTSHAQYEISDGSPSYADVRAVRALLKHLKLPTELVLQVLELAHYWATSRIQMLQPCRVYADHETLSMAGVCLDFSLSELFRGGPLNSLANENVKVKEFQFVIGSRDQGWTGHYVTGR